MGFGLAVNISPESIQENGVVGAGGAGFPAHVKMRARAELLILNAAECEPLLHKDKELLEHFGDEVIRGMQAAREMVGARKCLIGIKNKYEGVISRLEKILPADFQIVPLADVYPAGDEFILVYDATGRMIPPGGLPLDVGCVVNNVETMLNIARNRPVTRKYLTITGAVKDPCTLCVPVGISVREVIDAAGGPAIADWVVLLNGIMMGRLAPDASVSVTKTTGGIYIFPADHPHIRRYQRSLTQINRIGRSACDQCSFCTEMCPRYLLGHPIEPHKAMRALGFTMDKAALIVGTTYCCECNLCTMIACPEDLDPMNVCAQDKQLVKQMGLKWERGGREIKARPLYPARRTPTKRLMNRLGLRQFENNRGALREGVLAASRVRLPLKQHVGAPCAPVVAPGQRVREGDVIARPPDGQLGAVIHASISGRIASVGDAIEITA
ncbi:MAG: SLBB domain-containing protein [Candidatus Sumerlaeota bacterium]|nr:SLBB domain-containing protein [Candidatus Sumerlaeota bacterium]